jgi:hypothetical protein
MERTIKMKINYFIKRERRSNKNVKPHQTEKKLKTKVAQNQKKKKKEKEQISTPQISTTTRRFQLQKPSNNKAATC